jgi:transcriptional regulator with XRE-family HTH domain
MSAVVVGSVDQRQVVRCLQCSLTQFAGNNGLCRKCKRPLEDPEMQEVEAPFEPTEPETISANSPLAITLAETIRRVRRLSGLSQRELAKRMGVPRTYVSKIENEKATPTLSSIERISAALMVPVSELLQYDPHKREVRQLLSDEFLAELATHVPSLTPTQCVAVVNEVCKLWNQGHAA